MSKLSKNDGTVIKHVFCAIPNGSVPGLTLVVFPLINTPSLYCYNIENYDISFMEMYWIASCVAIKSNLPYWILPVLVVSAISTSQNMKFENVYLRMWFNYIVIEAKTKTIKKNA